MKVVKKVGIVVLYVVGKVCEGVAYCCIKVSEYCHKGIDKLKVE